MRIGEICTRNVVHCERGVAIPEVAQLMRNRNVGDVIVVESDGSNLRPVGVVTDRDLAIEVIAQRVAPDTLTAQDVMRGGLLTANQNDTVYDAIWLMRRRNVRRLPIVDDAGDLVGIVTVDDVVGFLSQEIAQVARVATDQMRVERRQRAPVAG